MATLEDVNIMLTIDKVVTVAVTCLSLLGASVSADEIHVYEGESIQAAIDTSSDGDEIIIHPGTYDEGINVLGKAIHIHSSDGSASTEISGNGYPSGLVTCNSGESPDSILEGLTISGSYFGGMFVGVNSCPTILNCTFSNNSKDGGPGTGGSGAGLSIYMGDPLIVGCLFTGNSASGGTLSAGSGGAVAAYDAEAIFVNCVFSGNSAGGAAEGEGGLGAAISSLYGSPQLINCVFYGNDATEGQYGPGKGGAIFGKHDPPAAAINCIVWGNSPDQVSGSVTVQYSDVMGGWEGAGNIDFDPLLVDPGSGDFHISTGSPCIDAGNNEVVPDNVMTDLDDNPRFTDDPGTEDTGLGDPPIVDMGCYEFQVIDCPEDINGDGTVDVLDLLEVLSAWGPCE